MSRRSPKSSILSASPCPCGLPTTYGECCGRLHRGEATAATAELLMRSRFSAFAVRDEAYLLRSWHPDTRPERLDLDSRLRWVRLEIVATADGGPFHSEGTVRFRAHYADGRQEGSMEELSRFVRVDGAWVYVDGVVD
ncbi:YchJ family protein [Kitasatospora sp. GP82]|uniref:YchJ family protein n=1 Tax=Kitasatospora sp. GP82 TaxID=3035089 RepID=UPI0024735914|nr:YchJ family protein [Kitasatospora sp. GP82]MDH6130572.1 SEC-C motif-containing protein [Kitasatospora sp. GP82]